MMVVKIIKIIIWLKLYILNNNNYNNNNNNNNNKLFLFKTIRIKITMIIIYNIQMAIIISITYYKQYIKPIIIILLISLKELKVKSLVDLPH
jgi:hypothetical protein